MRCVFRLSVEYCLEYLVNDKWIRALVSKETAVLLSTELITKGKLATVKRFEC